MSEKAARFNLHFWTEFEFQKSTFFSQNNDGPESRIWLKDVFVSSDKKVDF